MEKHPNYLEYRKIFDQVVRDILEGKLEYDQTEWHCGTAHCVRGWFEVKAAKHFYNQDYNPMNETFVNADGTVQHYSAIFDDPSGVVMTPTEIVAYLTGYNWKTLMFMFDIKNTHADIRRWAITLDIDLSPTREFRIKKEECRINVKKIYQCRRLSKVPNVSRNVQVVQKEFLPR